MVNSDQLAHKIISAQEQVIGPIALEQARKVDGIKIDNVNSITITGKPKQVLTDLIAQYEHILGQTSVDVCKDAVKDLIVDVPKDQLPDILQ